WHRTNAPVAASPGQPGSSAKWHEVCFIGRTHAARRTTAMQPEQIEIAHHSTAEAPGFGQCVNAIASPASNAETREPAPVGFLTLGIAWLFGLEALLADDRRQRTRR